MQGVAVIRRIFTFFFFYLFSILGLYAHEYVIGDIIEQDGISYKVLVTYLVVDKVETPDTVHGPQDFYCSGEAMVTKVDNSLKDVVIPPAINRFKVVGLTDSLFYEHEHDRIWLPDLLFAGNGCFAKLKLNSGALVLHNISNIGMGAFDELNADLIFDVTREMTWNKTFEKQIDDSTFVSSKPSKLIKINTRNLKFVRKSPIYEDCFSAVDKNYNKWISKAFFDDDEFMKKDLTDKTAKFNKKQYSTTPYAVKKKGLTITASAVNVKKLGYTWGSFTRDYYRQAKYGVYSKKKKTTIYYEDFIPVADATLKEGWYVKFVGEEGEVKYTLKGKKIKK